MPVISDEVKQLIKDSVDVELLVRSLGFNVSRVTSSEVRAPGKLHGGDNPTGFCVRLDTKKWRCFTKHCDEDGSGRLDNDLIALVMRVTGMSFMDAVQYLADFSGLSLDVRNMMVEETGAFRQQRDMSTYIRSIGRVASRAQSLPGLSEELVGRYAQERDDYFVKRGFSPDTLETFEVGLMTDHHNIPRATVPIRDASGTLVGLSARRTDNDEDPRYLIDYQFPKGRVLYNLHRALLSGNDAVIVVEGFKALWAVFEAGFSNVVACMGTAVTDDQVWALCASGFRNCVLLFDGDAAGIRGAPGAERQLGSAFNVSTIYLPEGKSPDSFDRNELRELLELYLDSF